MRGLKDGGAVAEARPTFPDVRGQGSNEGLNTGAVARKPVQHFLDVRGRVEDIILGNRETQKEASGHLTQPGNRSDSLYTGQQLTSTDVKLSDRAYALLCPVKGLSVCLNVPRTSSTSSGSLSVQVKAPKVRAKSVESEYPDEQKGGGIERVSECPTHILDLVRSPVCRLSTKVRAKVLESLGHLTSRRGKNDTFLLVSFPAKLGGPMRGLEGRSCCAEARPTFPDVRGQVEDIILESRETQTSLLASFTQPEQERLNIRHLSN
ncbi:hypothetical protein TNIN_249391 [Trichonephila inaurata madagascariensis]|uniref:Uncharacterized protein n=1 Tax=Trichonephila inaurata madagascariensis TaxID=2747483 RepID=A0A8X7C5G6_9ARAC|nr:hypothetical protein TNIN_249391 [Trichonephila inaurata madagascariensis]